jgi:hypothetical protein
MGKQQCHRRNCGNQSQQAKLIELIHVRDRR